MPVRNCFTLAMTNKLVVIINSLKVPKIKKLLLYELKFLVPNYSCLQNPWLGGRGLPPPDPHSLSSTEFVELPLLWTKFLGTPLYANIMNIRATDNTFFQHIYWLATTYKTSLIVVQFMGRRAIFLFCKHVLKFTQETLRKISKFKFVHTFFATVKLQPYEH